MLYVMPSTIVLFLSRNRSKRICVTIRPPDKTDKALWGLCFYCGKKTVMKIGFFMSSIA